VEALKRDLVLPYPPSVNHYWRHVQGRTFVSREGRRYRQRVCALLAGSRPMTGRIHMTVVLCPPDRRRRDLDNAMKSLNDSLAHAGVFIDDEQIDRLSIIRGPVVRGGIARVRIREVDHGTA
jgi:crossover junction endodeoxyribonuclease RusA